MRILIVDDHLVVRQGIHRLLRAAIPALDAVEAEDGAAALRHVAQSSFDVILLDLTLPEEDGYRLLDKLLAGDPKSRVVVFTMHSDIGDARSALRLGARGFVGKCAPAEELVRAVTTVANGGRYVDRQMAEAIALSRGEEEQNRLNARELEILGLLGQGKSLKEIAQVSGRTYKTVSNTCGAIKSKLGLKSSVELVRLSITARRQATVDE